MKRKLDDHSKQNPPGDASLKMKQENGRAKMGIERKAMTEKIHKINASKSTFKKGS